MGLTPTSGYEDSLGESLEALLKEGKTSLDDLVAGLNARNVLGPNGQNWTPALLKLELARLAP